MPPVTLSVCAIEGYDGLTMRHGETAQVRVDPADFQVLPYSLGVVGGAQAFLMPRPGSAYAQENPLHMVIYVRESANQIIGGARQAFGPAARRKTVPTSQQPPRQRMLATAASST